MLLNLFNVVYVLVAIAMAVFILLQRGAGAAAGSGFGSGASATVFGAQGATTFMSRATATLAGLFFLLSLAMGMYLGQSRISKPSDDLGVMSGMEVPKPVTVTTTPANGDVPAPAAAALPVSPKAVPDAPLAPPSVIPATTTDKAPAPATPAAAAPVKPAADAKKTHADAAKKTDDPKNKK